MVDEAKSEFKISATVEMLRQTIDDMRRKPHLVAPIVLAIAVFIVLATLALSDGTPFVETTLLRMSQVIQKGSPLIILALGVGLVIATGEIDLANTAIAAFGGVLYAILREHYHFSETVCLLMAVFSGGAVGWLNGLLVASWGAPSLIITWVCSVWLSVAALVMARAASSDGYGASVILTNHLVTGGYAIIATNFVFIAIVTTFVRILATLSITQQAKAVGADSQSSAYIGVKATKVKILVFVISGALGAIAGIMYAHSFGVARSVEIQDKSLVVVAICVLAGTLLSGGYFSPFAIVCSGLLWSLLELFVPPLRIPWLSGQAESHAIKVIFGFILMVAVLAAAKQLRGHLRSVLTVRQIDT